MDQLTVAETLRQVIEGEDFDSVEKLLNLNSSIAFEKLDGMPYSIAGNLWHCDYWNRLWLARLRGEKRPAKNIWAEDWHEPSADEWPAIQYRLRSNLAAAHQIASTIPFSHSMKSDEAAIKTLNQIAVHTAYHVGQSVLLKRFVKASMKSTK